MNMKKNEIIVTADRGERDIIEHAFDNNLAVNAGAGSGKTHEMVERIVNGVLKVQFSMDEIAVITFTRKAAGEMRERVIQRLSEVMSEAELEERERLEAQLVMAVTARISTIHSFCAAILKEKPVEAGIDPAFTMLDDGDESFFDEVFEQYREKVLLEDRESMPSRILKKLILE
ncbi:MAG TPA: UvrD-helicase domain-containing protein, partial [Spirochaetota bacterium]|nr:UvrD-helicase domain-containing protein [Spirochaetota bacterium]